MADVAAPEIKRGLDGVVVDTTAVSKVMPDINALVYRGYPVQDLAENCTFEEVAYLLWHDDLPTKAQLDEFTKLERSLRPISADLQKSIELYPKHAHPMDTVRTGVSFLGMEDKKMWDREPKANLAKAMNILAKVPTIIATDYRCRKGLKPIAPRQDCSMAENFFHMCFGEIPHKDIVKAFDVSLTLYAEHSFNASTFTSRVVTSTMSDIYSAIVGGICSLKGPLHGGANEEVMHMLKEVGEVSKAKAWMLDALATKKKIMGFGHRVYKRGDSRAPTMNKYGLLVAKLKGETKWHDISKVLEETMIAEKNIHPNLDFPAGPAYYLMGFDIDMFTPIFVMSRVTGWSAHIFEQTANNRLIRPLSQYTGQPERKVRKLSERS
ncbi:MAG: bifunctional 2-methylcitrate synthase/citrate synthase [Bdellovibrionales bacterium]|nr:bifunctional 2-methylcitrate synthase/citrate synthase [Bdellovibrionales bacterium]